MFKLTFEKGSLSGNSLEVTVPKIILGRQRDCHVRLKDDGVSRHHCTLEQREDGIYLCDLGATNGVRINGKRLREMEQKLAPGDRVQIGAAEIRLEIPAPAPAVTVAFDASKGARTEKLPLPPPLPNRNDGAPEPKTVGNLFPVTTNRNSTTASSERESVKRWAPLTALLGFFRTTSGAVTLGLLVAMFVAIFWLMLTPPPRQQQVAVSQQKTDEKRDPEWLKSILLGGAEEPKQQPPASDLPEPPPAPVAAQPPNDAPTAPVPFRARGGIRIVTGFEGSAPATVTEIGENAFAIDMNGRERLFFLFKVEGAAGQTVRFEFRNVPLMSWMTVNPVYSYVEDLAALPTLASEPVENPQPRRGKNGPQLPDTRGQQWHYIENVTTRGGAMGGVYSFEQTFEKDTAFVAMRAPYLPSYNDNLFAELQKNPLAKVVKIGATKEGRALWLTQIGEAREANGGEARPTVLIYGREHGNEHDTSFVAEGALQFLLSDVAEAKAIREKFCFLVMPLVDADGCAAGKYENMVDDFFWGAPGAEAIVLSAWFKQWMDSGNRLDVVFNLHNSVSNGLPHLMAAEFEPRSARANHCIALNSRLVEDLKGFSVARNPYQTGFSRFRLGGWLQEYYNALYMPYEINSQEPRRHLTLREMREMGAGMVRASASYLESPLGKELMGANTEFQARRLENWKKFSTSLRKANALVAEEKCRQRAEAEAKKQNLQNTSR
jgi:hypothetical protein